MLNMVDERLSIDQTHSVRTMRVVVNVDSTSQQFIFAGDEHVDM